MKRVHWPYVLLIIAVAAFLYDLVRFAGYLIDDTFISFRYAENLVAGNGLVFNVGERVEGYTNFLFVMLSALFLRLGVDPVWGTKAVALVTAVSALVLVARLVRFGPQPENPTGPAVIVLCLLLPLQAFAYWAIASFETMLFAGFFLWALYAALSESADGRRHGAAWIFVLLALTRPEGAYLFAVCTAVFFVLDWWHERSWAVLRRHAVNVVIFATTYGIYFLWRYRYYGHLFPNTFYAKVTGGEGQFATGLEYLRSWVVAFPALAAALVLSPLAIWLSAVPPATPPDQLDPEQAGGAGRDCPLPTAHCRLSPNRAFVAVYLVTLAFTAYVVSVGGDFMPFFRFFLPILPLACLLLAWSAGVISTRLERGRRIAVALIVVACAANLVFSRLTEEPYRAFVAHRTAVIGEHVGRHLRATLAPDDLIAVNTAGTLPYYSALPTIDMLGLTDANIAQRPIYIVSSGWAGHRRGWGEYVLDRAPRAIFWYNSAGSREPFYLSDHELADDPFFRFFYRPRAAALPPAGETDDGQRVIERFWGFPFGGAHEGTAEGASGDLGLRVTFRHSPLPETILFEGQIVANYFERDPRDEALWPLRNEYRGRVDEFVDAVAAHWQAAGPPPPGDGADKAEVDALCEEALRLIQAGDVMRARQVLTDAARRNAKARSPLVYQYIANLGVMAGDLFVAVNAEKEALRLAPQSPLYVRNLKSLLKTPYKEATKPHREAARARALDEGPPADSSGP